MPASDDLALKRAEVKSLTDRYKSGGEDAVGAFYQLSTLLLSNTILEPYAHLRLEGGDRRNAFLIRPQTGSRNPLRLRNRCYLKFVVSLYLAPPAEGEKLKVEWSSCQYQLRIDNGSWVFRYDYAREPQALHPAAHLQLRAQFREPALPDGDVGLEKVRFPTGRFSIESIIRLLVETFRVPCPDWEELWKPVLAESEKPFQRIAHPPGHG